MSHHKLHASTAIDSPESIDKGTEGAIRAPELPAVISTAANDQDKKLDKDEVLYGDDM
jgi:hypothetical protein